MEMAFLAIASVIILAIGFVARGVADGHYGIVLFPLWTISGIVVYWIFDRYYSGSSALAKNIAAFVFSVVFVFPLFAAALPQPVSVPLAGVLVSGVSLLVARFIAFCHESPFVFKNCCYGLLSVPVFLMFCHLRGWLPETLVREFAVFGKYFEAFKVTYSGFSSSDFFFGLILCPWVFTVLALLLRERRGRVERASAQ
ncbi:hypothetical protein Desku_0766 [Desulfofundulus kuznetsovii DSM 6115]|uniref:Uncharacterized protein n=1 Tax=Desulfofundulus kuznetsovii (strain DSM 6115 / VKM B-1805 / 17) TaxID=760568 RepID=A0AAU8P922_DESK7|nr:hypothetical protein Desku_0766 [Desulfofundulus kuznetsovii DSM 6115]